MKLLRLKITDPKGFRSLQTGFEYYFRNQWNLQEEAKLPFSIFEPFVCAGLNGSGKSNLLEALAAIFFQSEALRIRRNFLPEALQKHLDEEIYQEGLLDGFELEYQITAPNDIKGNAFPAKFPILFSPDFAHVRITKVPGTPIVIDWLNRKSFVADDIPEEKVRDFLLPEYVLGYSSGENQILSLPFFKMRFAQADEYWNALEKEYPYPGRPDSRMAYLDNEFSQAILLCNLLFQEDKTLAPFREEVGVQKLTSFRIVIKKSFIPDADQLYGFDEEDEIAREQYRFRLTVLLDEEKEKESDKLIPRLKRCATCFFETTSTNAPYEETLYLDYLVNDATKEVFKENFDNNPLSLFQAFQVLLMLNLYSVKEDIKQELYQSNTHYASDMVPILASDQRIMRFEDVQFSKTGVKGPVTLKSLSDGEHQLLHSLGLCLLFKNTNSLFLLDEPETHFNPQWRASFISRLRDCFKDAKGFHEMLITTHTPFLISDSRPEKVLVFNKENGEVTLSHPDYNTLGASINKITMSTFGKRETIGGYAERILESLRQRFKPEQKQDDKERLITEINQQLGDSVEKIMLIKTILDSMETHY